MSFMNALASVAPVELLELPRTVMSSAAITWRETKETRSTY